LKEKLNEAIMMLNKNLQEINIQNMDTELVAQMFKNYQSNVLFHLEGMHGVKVNDGIVAANSFSYKRLEGSGISVSRLMPRK
jgi:DASH complex subunit DAD4